MSIYDRKDLLDMELSERLYNLRREHDLSQEALANKLDVSRQAVSKWERGETAPDTWNLIALAELYDISLDALVRGIDQASEESDECTAGAEESAQAANAEEATRETPSPSDANGTWQSSAPAKDSVHINWTDGINVHDKDGTKVHVGWDGIHVDDPKDSTKVNISQSGIHVDDGKGNKVDSAHGEGVVINGRHFDNWHEAHNTMFWDEHHHGGKGSKAAAIICGLYGSAAIIFALVVGIAMDMPVYAGLAICSIPVFGCAVALIDALATKQSANKKRRKLTDLMGWTGISAFFAIGLTTNAWHPAWVCIPIAIILCWIVNMIWRPGKNETVANAN